jgi:hypothetical protein|tara:strand:+ start:253 stop:1704 length:1452 start_codon:yes stop_codon:yes gene_type:complete
MQISEQDATDFQSWMNSPVAEEAAKTITNGQGILDGYMGGTVLNNDGTLFQPYIPFFTLWKTGFNVSNIPNNESVNVEPNIPPNEEGDISTSNDVEPPGFGVSVNQPMMDRNFGSLGYIDQARQLIPDAAPADPAMASLLYFSKMGELASQPGATLLSSISGSFSSPAQYLLEREQAKERVAKERATVAAQLGRAGKGGTGKERMRDQVLRVAQSLSQGLSLQPNDLAELVYNIRELKRDKNYTLPDGRQVKEPGINMMEIIKQTYGDEVYNAILSRLGSDSSTTTIIDSNQEQSEQDVNTILFGDKELNIVSNKDLTAPQATAIANSTSAISNLKIAYDYFMAVNLSPTEFRLRLGMPNLGEKRTAISALRRALEILLRLRTGAAAPPAEVDNYMNMYAPSIFDTKRNVKIKFDDMMAFFQNIQNGITRSQNYTIKDDGTSTALDVNLAETIPNLDADVTENELNDQGITITDDGKILIEVD